MEKPLSTKKASLKRSVSLFEATLYGVGIILGAGIYALIGEAAGIAGNALWLSFMLAGTIASFTALSYAELSSMYPNESAEFLYIKNAFKKEWIAFLIAWTSIITGFVSIAAVALGFANYLSYLLPVPAIVSAIALIALLSLVNFRGIKESARLNIVLTLIEAGGLAIVIIIALPFLGSINYFLVPGQSTILSMISPITVAAALIFFAYIGFENLANITEETVHATKTIPKAVLLSLTVSTIIYVLVALSVVSVVPWEELAESPAPLSLVAERVFGSNAGLLLAIIALFSTTNTVLILLIAVSRRFYGISKEHCLPNILHKVHPKTRTPHYAIMATMLLAMLFAASQNIKVVAFLTDFGIFLIFLTVNIAVIFLRYSHSEAKRPFKIPLNVGRLPITALLGALSCAYMLFSFSAEIAAVSTAIFATAIPFYFLFKERFKTPLP